MKVRVEAGNNEYLLDLRRNGRLTHYTLQGHLQSAGAMSVEEIMPGLYSVLDGHRSFTVRLVQTAGQSEAWVGLRRFAQTISDPRDRQPGDKSVSASGPQQIRALMPGKVIKVLVELGESVETGTGLVIVEAMKMQNEMKAPRNGRITKIHAAEGGTVGSGEPLIEIE